MRRELSPTDAAKRLNTPPLQGRGKGWGVCAERLLQLNGFAREMRRQPTEPEKRLWRRLSRSQLGGFKFRRQAVIGPFITDFLCPQKALIVEVDGWTHDDVRKDARRVAALSELGFTVLRFTNTDVMENVEGVLTRILEVLHQTPDRWAMPHRHPSPSRGGAKCGRGAEAAGHQPRRERGVMVFGRFKSDKQLELQREFYRNCLEQIDDLEQRINDEEMTRLQNAFPDVWVDDQATRELPEKVKLARRYATELGGTLSHSSKALESMWPALEQLQGIIDHCEHAVQDLLAGLTVRQSLATIKKADDAEG